MEALNINWQQIADIGFLLLVTGISLRSLLVDRDALQKQRSVWKKELVDLEGSLRDLISEATEASNAFDSRIQRRQKGLEDVLNKIEAKVATIANGSSHFKMIPAEGEEMIDPPWALDDELPSHLRSRLESTTDNVKTSVSQIGQAKSSSKATLKESIEVETIDNDQAIFQQTSIVDPAAFKIAKRLLLEGKEIHVISRKLDIPVSEVRHLESLLRKTNLAEEESNKLRQKELSDVRKVIRDNSGSKNKGQSREAQILESLGLGSYLEDLERENQEFRRVQRG